MRQIILPVETLSVSGNIALYPALAMNRAGCLGLAWYEYGSPYETDRSDVWVRLQDASGGWSVPVNISKGVSYNNGPSLLWVDGVAHWCCAWHSWRPPGKEPFTPDGDINNIWASDISTQGIAGEPYQMLPEALNTEYASLAMSPDGAMHLLYQDRMQRRQCLSRAARGEHARLAPGRSLPGRLGDAQHGDMAIAPDGTVWIASVGADGDIELVSGDGEEAWGAARRISVGNGTALTRPKLSLSADGALWVACHSNTWGSRTAHYRVRVGDGQLMVRMDSGESPGNHCWACNAVSVRGVGEARTYSLGPDVFAPAPHVTAVTVEDCLYDPGRGFGFDRRPRSQLRKLGDELTRGSFYDDAPASFRVDLAPGDYDLEVVYSPWIAPTPEIGIELNAEVLQARLPEQVQDEVFLFRVGPGGEVDSFRVSSGRGCNENRPSKLVHDARTGRKHLAWTCYGPKHVEIVCASFTMP